MVNNKKNAFTLVELLAVIAVLGLILIIAIPKVMDTLNTQKKRTLELTTKSIIKAAEEKYIENSSYGINEEITCESVSNITNSDFESCDIEFDEVGNATVMINGKGRYEDLSCQGTKDNVTCQKGEIQRGLHCTYNGELVPGAEFVHNQYTYRYKQEYVMGEDEDGNEAMLWSDTQEDGWHVRLTDKSSTEPVNKPICSYINGKPLISTSFMFMDAQVSTQTSEIDVSSWNTDNVTNMSGMFMGTTGVTEIKGLNKLETGNVTNMGFMFYGSVLGILDFEEELIDPNGIRTLDLSNFDTSKVTNMMGMFVMCGANSIDVGNFNTGKVTDMSGMFSQSLITSIENFNELDTSNVTNMSGMFSYSAATSLDLSGLDTSKVTDMSSMFSDNAATTIKFPTKWTTGENANMSGMFSYSAATSLDLSGLDTSKVTDMSSMFSFSAATTIKFPNEWTTGENANMSSMFYNSAATSLDLSGLDTSNVVDMTLMFQGSAATVGYARTQADADKFNNAEVTKIPSTLIFTLKPTS